MTFDVKDAIVISVRYKWQDVFELPCLCRGCHQFTVFCATQSEIRDSDTLRKSNFFREYDGCANDYVSVEGYVSQKDVLSAPPPEHVPDPIKSVFSEGAMCLAVGCPNAAGAMFRMCVDLSTRRLLPDGEVDGLNSRIRRDLGLRLPWLFENDLLPKGLEQLSKCIREDGNDGAHAGTLKREDAEDLVDFTRALLERLFTEPARLKIAEARREARRQTKS
jgi:hypothetical protein